jgi:starch phosphorylase
MVRPIHKFTVVPSLPARIEQLRELAYNVRWSWNYETVDLFRRLDRDLWETTGHNPVKMLGIIEQHQLEEAATNDGFLAHFDRVHEQFSAYMAAQTSWYRKTHGAFDRPTVAYFSAEFGLTECMPIYSGGLGILSGDHLKAASDLGYPLVGVGLLYQEGYFRQYLNPDGWQKEDYPINDFYNLPLFLERDSDGSPRTIDVRYPGRSARAQIWRIQAGRVAAYMLDTNIPANSSEDRTMSDELYGGDLDMRIRQEILLGIGGLRALYAMDIKPSVCHMNEGHSAFLSLERIRLHMQEFGMNFAEAREATVASNVFTTHTPEPAGIDRFPVDLMDRYFSDYYGQLKISREELLALGRENQSDQSEPFSMAVLALRLSARANGVSKLHAAVARRMWRSVWPAVPEEEIPIAPVTNGVHLLSWISNDMTSLLSRYLGLAWAETPDDPKRWQHIYDIPDEELWRTHERRRERLVAVARGRLLSQLRRRGAPPSEIAVALEVLNPAALTIGFARRFATYKRANLLLRDINRLAEILSDEERPVQFIFAGKAHPKDDSGKQLIRQIIHQARKEPFRHHVVFLENYDIELARYLVQGCDLWLNTPRRPREASGTSGMKAAINGVLNCSTLDGWWDEAYRPEIGWAIGNGDNFDDQDYQDSVEASALYDLLEDDIIPLFYDRNHTGLPRRWIAKVKASMSTVCPTFNTVRMVHEYAERFYLPSQEDYGQLTAEKGAKARELTAWKRKVRDNWPHVQFVTNEDQLPSEERIGMQATITTRVRLGALLPSDVRVEIYHGAVDGDGDISGGGFIPMTFVQVADDGSYEFQGSLGFTASGLRGYTLRIIPHHSAMNTTYEPGLIRWASDVSV